MFTRDGDACRGDDMRFDATCPQPTGQPEAVTPSSKSHHGPRNHTARLGCLFRPTSEQLEKRCFFRLELLRWMTLDTRNDASDEPARRAHFDDDDQRASCSRAARAAVWALHRLFPATIGRRPRRSPHSIFSLLRWLASLLRALARILFG